MNTAHTPGPWQVCWPLNNLDITEIRTVKNERTGHIATAGVSFCKDETLANARLIAAAPELLEALRECEHFISRAHGGEGMTEDERWALLSDARDDARAAIAAVTGEKP
jgi:hypothetical protein